MPTPSRLRQLDDDAIAAIAEAYRLGEPQEQVAGLVKVTARTLQRWIADGTAELDRLADNPAAVPDPSPTVQRCVALVVAIKEADARFVQENLALIVRAARNQTTKRTKTYKDGEGRLVTETTVTEGGNWQAAAWLLERRHNSDFGRQVRQLVSGPDGGPIVTREERAQNIAEQLASILENRVAGELPPTPVGEPVDTESRAAGE